MKSTIEQKFLMVLTSCLAALFIVINIYQLSRKFMVPYRSRSKGTARLLPPPPLDNPSINYSLYPSTDMTAASILRGNAFFKSLKPPFDCSRFQTRVGTKTKDGGKWTCGLKVLGRHTRNGYNCTVYSLGIAGESSFEAEILNSTNCQVYGFDPAANEMGKQIKPGYHRRVIFKKYAVTNSDQLKNRMATLKTLMAMNGNSWIDILKMDVEAAEYDILPNVFQDFEVLPFGQLLIEMHMLTYSSWEDLISIFSELEQRGMRMFYREINRYYPNYASEFSFVNLNALKLFIDK